MLENHHRRLKYHHLLILETRFVFWMFGDMFKRRVLNAFSSERVVTVIKYHGEPDGKYKPNKN